MGLPASRAGEVRSHIGLDDRVDRKVKSYSTGMRQRLAPATAMLPDPGLLVLDEPANGLDPDDIRWLRTTLRSPAEEGRTVLVLSHLLAEIEQTVDDVVVVQRTVRCAGSLSELTSDGAESLEDRFFKLVGSTPGTTARGWVWLIPEVGRFLMAIAMDSVYRDGKQNSSWSLSLSWWSAAGWPSPGSVPASCSSPATSRKASPSMSFRNATGTREPSPPRCAEPAPSSTPLAAGARAGSTAAATGRQTPLRAVSCPPGCATTRALRRTTNAVPRRARLVVRSSGASSDMPPARSSICSGRCLLAPC